MTSSIILRPGTEADLPVLCDLSRTFVEEQCCNGMVPDTMEDWRQYRHITVAELNGHIIGYSYGSAGKSHMRKAGSWEKGDAFYDLESLYILPEYRSAGIGRMLFEAQEQIARSLGCTSMQLAAVSRDYRRLLDFYESMGMEFWSAWMIKSLQ